MDVQLYIEPHEGEWMVVWQLLTTDVTIKANTMIITSRAIRMPLQLRVLGLAETSWNVGRHEIYFIIKLCMIIIVISIREFPLEL